MEKLRQLARVYYEIASADERAAEQKYFDKLRKNGKGEIRFDEYKNSVSNWLSHKSVFDLLNSKHDGILSRGDATALYYVDKKMVLPVCQDFKCLILYMYITCTTCLNKHARRFDLCGNCFEKRTIRHEHPWKDFSDQFSLLENWKKGEMDKLREIAKVHYKIGSEEVRDLADKFFKSIGPDKDKFVDFAKFSAFMRREGYLHLDNLSFFKELDRNGDEKLDSKDVRTLYYILKSGRPPCNWCGKFIPGIFFSCLECFDKPRNPFNVCLTCYESKRFEHNDHGGRALLLDNYTIFEIIRDPAWPRRAEGVSVNKNNQLVSTTGSSSNQRGRIDANRQVTTPSTADTRIVPANNNRRMGEHMYNAVQVGIGVTGVLTNLFCSIL